MISSSRCRKRVRIGGVVQGVGFRPFLWRLAMRHGLTGWVENAAEGVVAEVEGDADAIHRWIAAIRAEPPPLAIVGELRAEELPLDHRGPTTFVIHDAMEAAAPDLTDRGLVPPDIATCPACLADIRDPSNRRFRHPFATCTECGPRFTFVEDLPYDRPRTTMREFAMCEACAAEYRDPADRRFHAQPIACPQCGPVVWFCTPGDPGGITTSRPSGGCTGVAAIQSARARLRAGDILAIKGLGGFHLVCDATNPDAVERLRRRKRRPAKPLAVMVADVETARRCGTIDEQEERILAGRERPILLVPTRDTVGLAAGIAPGTGIVGLMLPATPLHHLLAAGLPPLVATSGNLAEEPIVHDNRDAADRLAPLVDGFLMHDRGIVVPCDDSVVRCVAGVAMPIRRSRGHTPLAIRLAGGGPAVLAVGGELKAAICLADGHSGFMSQHLGDMGSLEALESLGLAADHLMRLFGIEPAAVACDLHPGYVSTAWARRFAEDRGIPVVCVQHHEAHVAALLADHACLDGSVIGVCFDGTGYGRDGSIQGGEVLVVEAGAFRRAAHLAAFPLPGGDACIRHPWRAAVAILHAAGIDWHDSLPPCAAASQVERSILRRQLEGGLGCVAATSMGRLFDAVASLAGVRQSIGYEAEAALALEELARRTLSKEPLSADSPAMADAYEMPVLDGDPLWIEGRPAIAAVGADVLAGRPATLVATRFHRGVAAAIATVCRRLRAATGIGRVGLTGGVFQNAVLVRLTARLLRADGFDLLLHERVPPNDGGIALGQAAIARRLVAR